MEAINRATGALLGMFVGDAIGIQTEGREEQALLEEFPQGIAELYSIERKWGESAEITECSVLGILLAQSIITLEGYDAEHSIATYRKWIKLEPTLVRPSLEEMFEGTPLIKSENNYALMRVAPIGVAGTNKTEKEIALMAESECIMTNLDQTCIDANKALSWAIAETIRGVEHQFRLGSYLLAISKKYGLEDSVQQAIQRAMDGKTTPRGKTDTALFCLELALYAFFHTNSFEEGMRLIVMRGGSANANASVYGAIAGAFYGDEEIPIRWKEEVEVPDTLARYIKKQTTFRRQNLSLEFMAESMAEKLLEM
ncbi:MAG TPA: ADP-ribosylglycohydrolase family protein [Sphaerochaeta sp.]|nr:ADP-ribosylglycohydrolase family protein [Sphaerochaeta sp.]